MKYYDPQTLSFLLSDVHHLDELLKSERYAAYDKASIDLLLDAVKDFSDTALFPYIQEMDEKPSVFKNGRVHVHEQFGPILKKAGEMGLVSAAMNEEGGGLQMPMLVVNALYFIMEAANNHVTGYLGLTAGAANVILTFGSEALKQKYVPNMLSMQWGGTMCLTEPQAGSSLSDITASAKPLDNGSYSIKGQKIFISASDHQFADNFIHLVLARIEGAPAGTKGISLFVVPQYHVNDDGSKGEYNHVDVVGEFVKLGQRGYCTNHLSFGDGGESAGYLIGDANHGLSYMFQLMNEARIATGRMGTGIASAAYYASLEYAKERPQGRKLQSSGKKDPTAEQTLIINHPDVKRMLLHQKATVEGCLSLVLQCSYYLDKYATTSSAEKNKYHQLTEILNPVAKTYPSEAGKDAVDTGLQILGGYGYMMDFILQQYLRDIRIISIYEGTTGIQSLDLLGRKVTMNKGEALQLLAKEMENTILAAMEKEELKGYAITLGESSQLIQSCLGHLVPFAMKGNHEKYLADATLFMDLFSTIVIGWQWLKMGLAALNQSDETFKAGKLNTLDYFFKYEMSRCKGLQKTICSDSEVTINMGEEMF
ncbi:butyryl-CoA dehydrogenase [Reichenbachiella faecimaris]|uniref:Butyryl-CoA dehydrogenase n=1 Tax=Reichenbachiella faecimaris TaxID=692418 RepID=A0A1W2G7L3_REIFA|nr:acyl-CoA dehydrogenase [Reichenbachiella faecimaris]SMD32623.1 butyryl-CoA dehydrogenase [Reichenbachiella faecimaris]